MAQTISEPIRDRSAPPFNLKMKTLGGSQFWTDVRFAGGWRIQRNSATGHHRLIDPQWTRHAWGVYAHCEKVLDQKVRRRIVKPMKGRIMILMHGLVNSRQSMRVLARHLKSHGAYSIVNLEYASSQADIATHAADLHDVIRRLGPDVTEINFVAHSMGNIVIRHYLNDQTNPNTGQQGDSRIKRLVMIGPPNHGSKMASLLKNSLLFKGIGGVSGQQLGEGWPKLAPRLAIPNFEFGIIAGAQADDNPVSNLMLQGKDDFTVSLDEAKLVGARDLLVRPMLHITMTRHPETLAATLNFFRHGYFVSEKQRRPIQSPGLIRR